MAIKITMPASTPAEDYILFFNNNLAPPCLGEIPWRGALIFSDVLKNAGTDNTGKQFRVHTIPYIT